MAAAAAVLAGVVATGFLLGKRRAAAPAVRLAVSAERIARGKYIYTVGNCDGCHSVRDWTRFGAPVIEAYRGQGVEFPAELGLGRQVASANITSDAETGLGAWSDGEKIRAIREGIDRDGRALDPLMPARRFGRLSDDDVGALVVYLNTLAPVKHAVPGKKASWFARLWSRTARRAGVKKSAPDRGNRVKYGAYLATLAGCRDCHTASGRSPAGRAAFAGGRGFRLAGATVVSTNITPEPYTGIGRWTEQDWLDLVYRYREYAERDSPHIGRQSVTVMPWLSLSQLREDDLRAIYAFLRTQKPVYRAINPHPVE